MNEVQKFIHWDKVEHAHITQVVSHTHALMHTHTHTHIKETCNKHSRVTPVLCENDLIMCKSIQLLLLYCQSCLDDEIQLRQTMPRKLSDKVPCFWFQIEPTTISIRYGTKEPNAHQWSTNVMQYTICKQTPLYNDSQDKLAFSHLEVSTSTSINLEIIKSRNDYTQTEFHIYKICNTNLLPSAVNFLGICKRRRND